MSYEERNRTSQNVLGVMAMLLLLAFSTFLRILIMSESRTSALLLLFVLLYFVALLGSGILGGIVFYRKDSYKILGILVPIYLLGDFIFSILFVFGPDIYPHYYMDLTEVFYWVVIGPGAIILFFGCFLGVLIKHKIQNGKHYTMYLPKKVMEFE